MTLTADEVAVLVSTAAAAPHQSDFPYRHAAELAVRKLMFDLSGLPSKTADAAPPGPRRKGMAAGKGGRHRRSVHLPTTFKSGSLAEHLEQLEGQSTTTSASRSSTAPTAPAAGARRRTGLRPKAASSVRASARSIPGLVYRQGVAAGRALP